MSRTRAWLIPALPAAVLFAAGIARLFILRFESGDVYPAYSSLRADPLGTKALYEALDRCPEVEVRRNYRDIQRLHSGGDSTLLVLGDTIANDEYLPGPLVGSLNSFLRRGGRLVMTLFPRNLEPSKPDPEDAEEDAGEDEGEEEDADDRVCGKGCRDGQCSSRSTERGICVTNWLQLSVTDLPVTNGGMTVLSTMFTNTALPRRLSCHTSLCFTNLGMAWTPVYLRKGRPVIITRRLGAGTVVLSALSYFVSNEAMLRERKPDLLSWLIGPGSQVVFDESHLGITHRESAATLARKYGLHRAAALLAVLAGLFVWKNTVRLVPPAACRSDTGSECVQPGRDATSGLINLLRRNIPATALLDYCFREWRKSQPLQPLLDQSAVEAAGEIVEREKNAAPKARNPVGAYNAIAEAVNRRDHAPS